MLTFVAEPSALGGSLPQSSTGVKVASALAPLHLHLPAAGAAPGRCWEARHAAASAAGLAATCALAGHTKRRQSAALPARRGAARVVRAAADGPALLCDCDGTLVETERDGHRVSFNQAFKQLGYNCEWSVELYGDLLTTGGGKERMTRYFIDYNTSAWPHSEPPTKKHPAIQELHEVKTRLFMDIVESGSLPLREGIKRLLTDARAAGWTIAVCSTSNEKAVEAVVRVALPEFAPTTRIFAGDIVKAKKPDPSIYNLAAATLGLNPAKCVVVEDTNIGLRAGKAAGMHVLVTRSIYSGEEDFAGADFNVRSCEEITFERDLAPLVKQAT